MLEHVCVRLGESLGLNGHAKVWLIPGSSGYDLHLNSISEDGDWRLKELAENPWWLCRSLQLAPIQTVHLKRSAALQAITVNLDDALLFKGESEGLPKMQNLDRHFEALLPLSSAIGASLFLIDFDGIYQAYFEGGHPGQPVVSHEEMIGTRAIEKLPPDMARIVQRHHDQAIATLEPQTYFYDSPISGRKMKSLAIPYPEHRQVALFVMEAEGSAICLAQS